ncbi:NUC173-domain-containing protein [Coniophora puteana RWD-64-598 SS2]|uniref:NUC173-domain-containing protein n=1 Tax=Coniophora puteana (strain RWD-64-598) TaxID=741705 RepID=A0A5M3MVG3_CONPW|nr:NUC173-domain-containing protein [Coniophora puteana RWD-64-598 SS2]EIW83040.1 NUC173-domain-containing protein [Coniophora puteana RWD-64-598 SS2]
MESLESALGKIRPHTQSSLAHQKAPAHLLQAIDGTLAERESERTSTAYFAAIVTALDSSVGKRQTSLGDGDLLPAELYLLALVAPFVPQSVVQAQLWTTLELLAPLFPSLTDHAPPLRSWIAAIQALVSSADRSQLDKTPLVQAFNSVLHLTVDHRPKVRKRAAEAVKAIIDKPPLPLARHPYSARVAQWAHTVLAAAAASPIGAKGKSQHTPETAIHLIQFLRTALPHLPPPTMPELTPPLLSLPRLGNPFLSQSSYALLADLLAPSQSKHPDEYTTIDIAPILTAVLTSPPTPNDISLAPAWLALLAAAAHSASPSQLTQIWRASFPRLAADARDVRSAAASACVRVASAPEFPASQLVPEAVKDLSGALEQLQFARAIPDVLGVIAALVFALRIRDESGTTHAEKHALPLVRRAATLRVQKGFEAKEHADAVLRAALQSMGAQVVLDALPLNLLPEERAPGDSEPRAFLLPLLVGPQSAPLAHFVQYFIPLSIKMFDKAQQASSEAEKKVWEVLVGQVWAALGGYCWGGGDLSKALTPDFAQLLTQVLYNQPELRSSVLKALKTLVESNTILANSDADSQPKSDAADGDADNEEDGDEEEEEKDENKHTLKTKAWLEITATTSEQAKANLALLSSQAESWLAVLFNVFGSVPPRSRGAVGDVLRAWIGVAGVKDVKNAYKKIMGMLDKNLPAPASAQKGGKGGAPKSLPHEDEASVPSTMLDLALLLLPALPPAEQTSAFVACARTQVLGCSSGAVQKRAYRVLARVAQGGKVDVGAVDEDARMDADGAVVTPTGGVDVLHIFRRLEDTVDVVQPGAKRDRLALLAALVPHLPDRALHAVPALIPEAVLGTKEPSEKARSAAFALVVALGSRMQAGGIVRRGLVAGMTDGDEAMDGADGQGEVQANVDEFVTMVAGGLAGASAHMISATITAIARLVFDFKDDISVRMHEEVLQTLIVFITSANREIAKAALGYAKLAAHVVAPAPLSSSLPALVRALLRWAGEHKNRFKLKVRHIFERLVRRVGWDVVNEAVRVVGTEGESMEEKEEARRLQDVGEKVLVGIKKRRERAKRKKAAKEEEGESEEEAQAPARSGDAFEDVLYGSESEADSSDDDDDARGPSKGGRAAAAAQRQNQKGAGKRHGLDGGMHIRMDDGDEPMDLLAGASARLTNTHERRKKPGQDARHFKMDADTGKMVIDAEEEGGNGEGAGAGGEDVEGTAYREGLTGADGFTRGPNGRVKFNKDTKKRRRAEAEMGDGDGDVEMGEANVGKKKKKGEPRPGNEFRAKRAGGDVKKGGVDPYAYLSLSQAAKKKGGKGIGIAGKR